MVKTMSSLERKNLVDNSLDMFDIKTAYQRLFYTSPVDRGLYE